MKKKVLKIALISPKGPLYRRRGGIFKQSLRYMPLTFPTLAALIPEDVPAEVACYDEGIEELPVRFSPGRPEGRPDGWKSPA